MAYSKIHSGHQVEVTIDPDIEAGPSLDRGGADLSGNIGAKPSQGKKNPPAVLIPGTPSGEGDGSHPAGASDSIRAVFDSSAHPIALFSLLFFKALPVLAFILGGWFISSGVLNLVLIILFSSAEFWVVKNISGRLLVGLRWWNEVREDGTSVWLFESRDVSQIQCDQSAADSIANTPGQSH